MEFSDERLMILKKVERGELTLEEADFLLRALETPQQQFTVDEPEEVEPVESVESVEVFPAETTRATVDEMDILPEPDSGFDEARMKKWRYWRNIPLWISVILTILGATWIYLGWKAAGFGWGFFLAWIPFLMGVCGIFLFWNSKWLHVRVRQKPGSKPAVIRISLPLPLGAGSWIFHAMGNRMGDKIKGVDVDEVISAVNSNEPIHIWVDDEDGEQVEVYIG